MSKNKLNFWLTKYYNYKEGILYFYLTPYNRFVIKDFTKATYNYYYNGFKWDKKNDLPYS